MCRRKREYLQAKSEKLSAPPTSCLTDSATRGTTFVPLASVPHVTFSAPIVTESERGQTFPLPVINETRGSVEHTLRGPPGVSESSRSVSQSASSDIRVATGIPTVLSGIGTKSMQLQSHSRTKTPPTKGVSKSVKQRSSQPLMDNVTKSKSFSTSKQQKTKLSPRQQASASHSGSKLPSTSHSGSKIHKNPSLPISHKPPAKENLQGHGVKGSTLSAKFRGDPTSDFLSTAVPEGYDPQLLEYMEGLERYRTRLSKTKP